MTEFTHHNRLIEAYLDRSIVAPERDALEREAASDPQLERQIKLQRGALIALEIICQDEARATFASALEQLKATRKRRKRNITQGLIGFAAVCLLGLTLWKGIPLLQQWNQDQNLVEQSTPPDPVSLSVSFFQPHELNLQPSRTRQVTRLVERSQTAYQAARYEEAIPELKALLEASSRRTDARLALGICYLALDSTSQAAQQFIPIIDRNKGYTQEARWYLALTYFRAQMLIQALGLMEEIASTEGHFRQQEARDFLTRLKGLKP
jgi:tetratricopeptide (TPR) repeat protein